MISAALLIFFTLPDAQAQTARQRKQAAFSVVLQPFSLVQSEIRSVAAPATERTQRILRPVATAPIKAAYYKQRRYLPRLPRANRVDDYYQQNDEDGYGESIRVAYQSARRMPAIEPRAKAEGDDESDEDEEQDNGGETNRHTITRGDRPTVAGRCAILRNGVAYAPSQAPENVKNAIWAANALRRKPYVWGGGHGSFYDHGYDCSGSVSFALHGAGLLAAPMPSSDLMGYGERGRGRWITVYSRPGHTFAIIAGLRLDTTDLDRGQAVGPRWYISGRDTRDYVARHPAGF